MQRELKEINSEYHLVLDDEILKFWPVDLESEFELIVEDDKLIVVPQKLEQSDKNPEICL